MTEHERALLLFVAKRCYEMLENQDKLLTQTVWGDDDQDDPPYLYTPQLQNLIAAVLVDQQGIEGEDPADDRADRAAE